MRAGVLRPTQTKAIYCKAFQSFGAAPLLLSLAVGVLIMSSCAPPNSTSASSDGGVKTLNNAAHSFSIVRTKSLKNDQVSKPLWKAYAQALIGDVQCFEALKPIMLHCVLSRSLLSDPPTKPVVIVGLICRRHSAMPHSLRELFQIRETLLPLIGKRVPGPACKCLKALPTISVYRALSCSLTFDPLTKPIAVVGLEIPQYPAMPLATRELFQIREAYLPTF